MFRSKEDLFKAWRESKKEEKRSGHQACLNDQMQILEDLRSIGCDEIPTELRDVYELLEDRRNLIRSNQRQTR